MTRFELILLISKKMNKGRNQYESYKAYQCIKSYFADLETKDLITIANQYGITFIGTDFLEG